MRLVFQLSCSRYLFKGDGTILANDFEFMIVDWRGGEVGEGTFWSCQLSSASCYFR